MNEMNINKVWKETFGQLVLICTETPEHKTNLATVGWWTLLSYNPGMVCFAMAKTSYSGERVRETAEVLLAVPSTEMKKTVISCGSTTGRDTDKAVKFGIELQDIPSTNIKVPVQSRVVLKAKLTQTIEAGDHYLYICNVENCYQDETKEALFL